MTQADLLVELGTEELPPNSLMTLANAFTDEVVAQLAVAELTHGEVKTFATPRRLAFLIKDVQSKQQDKTLERRGPAVKAAFDADGNPTKAATGFAQSVGLTVEELSREETDKGAWLMAKVQQEGKTLHDLLPDFLQQAINKLPIPKRMRWGDSKVQFVRPVHWLLVLFGDEVIPLSILELDASQHSRGHRFHSSSPVIVESPESYESQLNDAYVIADFAKRRDLIRSQVEAAGQEAGGEAVIDDALLDEVTALVEWPVPLVGHFDESFLRVPQEAIITAMQEHQRYFPVVDAKGDLLNTFITISNIDSSNKELVIYGNEKVIRPRLADAAFFFDNDKATTLLDHAKRLEQLVFQEQLGTVADKCQRISQLAGYITELLGGKVELAQQAGKLCKADLVTEMVNEFDTMQGVMGYYLAQQEGLESDVAIALKEHYLPRFSGDGLPSNRTGQAVALADKIDTLVGIFGIGQTPTGDRDPYALRRATLGILRIIIEKSLGLDLDDLVQKSVSLYGDLVAEDTKEQVLHFIQGRYRAFYQDQGISTPVILSVLAVNPSSPLDFHQRVHAVAKFQQQEAAQSLAEANKRVANILAKNAEDIPEEVEGDLLEEEAEQVLAGAIVAAYEETSVKLDQYDYAGALTVLAELNTPVNDFFEQVMVMAENQALRKNRLALLAFLRDLFLQVADISELS